jgi:serine/threonine-protein kinase
MAAGLAHLHARGFVHRDLKPANVLFDEEGRPKLGDFGLARHIAGSGTLTEAGTVLGTAAYLSPEQAGGEPAGAASDVYSFGVILFRMLTGALPFAADEALALVDMHRNAPPPAVEELQPDAPPELAALTAACLRKDPAERPADGTALLAALGGAPPLPAAATDTQATQILAAPARRPPRTPRRGMAVIGAAVVFLAVAGGVLAWAVSGAGGPAPAGTVSTGSRSDRTRSGSRAGTTHSAPSQTTSTRGTTERQPTTTLRHTTTTTPATTPPTTTTIPTITPPTTTTLPPTTTVPNITTSTTPGGTTTATGTT